VLALLLLAYTFNFIDRSIIATIGPKIREDLGLTSTQIGLLGGLYFAILYTLLGIPIARLAERFDRVTIISTAVVLWSGFTVLCGAAGSFAALAVCRFGVGVGEAGLTPPSHSLISDYFEPRKRASALSIYSFGIPLGIMSGAVAGGWVAQHFSWRIAFMLVGLPGVLIALLVKLVIKEPPRGHSEPEARERKLRVEEPPPVAVTTPKGHWFAEEIRKLKAVAGILFCSWPVMNMILGVTLAAFGTYGADQFVPQYFRAAYHLDRHSGPDRGPGGRAVHGTRHLGWGVPDRLALKAQCALVFSDPRHRSGHSHPDLHFGLFSANLARGGHDPTDPGDLSLHLSRSDLRSGAEHGGIAPAGDGGGDPAVCP
jgi:MFS family permease